MSQLKYRLSPETLWSHLYSALVESTIRDKTMLDAKSKRVVILKLKKGINWRWNLCEDLDTISRLINKLGSKELKEDLESGFAIFTRLTGHRHLVNQPLPGYSNGRSLKIQFSSSDKRNTFLQLYKKINKKISPCWLLRMGWFITERIGCWKGLSSHPQWPDSSSGQGCWCPSRPYSLSLQ